MTYTVHASWDGTGWWTITVPEVPGAISQCRRLDQAAADAAEVIEIQTGHPVDPADLQIVSSVPGDAGEAAERARALRERADTATAAAGEQTRTAVRQLVAAGFSLRDVGALTGISYQRAGQLAAELQHTG